MKKCQLFNQIQLLNLSGLTRTQLRQLHKYELLLRPKPNVTFFLEQVIYCRIVYWLRKEFSFQKIRTFLLPFKYYLADFISYDYGLITFRDDIPPVFEIIDKQDIKDSILSKLETQYIYRISELAFDEYKGKISLDNCYVSLKAIRKEILNRAYEYKIDSIDIKFGLPEFKY